MRPTVWAITIKGIEQDSTFGINKYVWVTDKQAERILDLQYDEKHKDDIFMASGVAFRIKDIKNMKRLPLSEAKGYFSFDREITEKVLLEYNSRKPAALPNEQSEQRKKLLDKWNVNKEI